MKSGLLFVIILLNHLIETCRFRICFKLSKCLVRVSLTNVRNSLAYLVPKSGLFNIFVSVIKQEYCFEKFIVLTKPLRLC